MDHVQQRLAPRGVEAPVGGLVQLAELGDGGGGIGDDQHLQLGQLLASFAEVRGQGAAQPDEVGRHHAVRRQLPERPLTSAGAHAVGVLAHRDGPYVGVRNNLLERHAGGGRGLAAQQLEDIAVEARYPCTAIEQLGHRRRGGLARQLLDRYPRSQLRQNLLDGGHQKLRAIMSMLRKTSGFQGFVCRKASTKRFRSSLQQS